MGAILDASAMATAFDTPSYASQPKKPNKLRRIISFLLMIPSKFSL